MLPLFFPFSPLTCTLCCLIVPLLSLFASLSFFALFALLSRLFFTPLSPAFSSSSYIIFSLSTSPPPSPHPFYFILSHDLHSARHFSYFSSKSALPAFLSMLSSSLPLSLIYLNASPQLFFFNCCFSYLQILPFHFPLNSFILLSSSSFLPISPHPPSGPPFVSLPPFVIPSISKPSLS